MVPMVFFARRMFLCLTLIFLQSFFWSQIVIQLLLVQFVIFFLQYFKPLSSGFSKNIETFNEVVNLIFLYLLMCFTDFLLDVEVAHGLGFVFIFTFSLVILVHVIILLFSSFKQLKMHIKKCCRKLRKGNSQIHQKP